MEAVVTNDACCSKKICSASECFALLIDELIFEILSWLPPKCLTRCQIVCKLWRMIIKSRKFVEKHMQRAKPFLHYDMAMSGPPSDESFIFANTIDGLILEQSDDHDYYRIRNPTTNLDLVLPEHCFERDGYLGMSYLPSIDKYKVSRFSINADYTSFCIDVVIVGVDVIWNPVDVPFSCLNEVAVHCKTLNGVNYILKYCLKKCCQLQIMVFQSEDEKFVMIPVPQRVELLYRTGLYFDLVKWNNNCGIWCMLEGVFHIWVMQEDYKKAEWDEIKIVLCSTVLKQYPFIKQFKKCRLYEAQATKLFMYDMPSMTSICYDFKSKEILLDLQTCRWVAASLVTLI